MKIGDFLRIGTSMHPYQSIFLYFIISILEELKIKRNLSNFHDSRVHACLYFITPNGHGLKSIDLVCMKKLDAKVNIIPIIAKADTINKTELTNFKVMNFCHQA